MDLLAMDYEGVSIKNLAEPQVQAIKGWRREVMSTKREPKVGLWLFGPRNGGTSYAAKVIVPRMAFVDGFDETDHVQAHDLVRATRSMWSLDKETRANADDDVLAEDARFVEGAIEWYFYKCPLLWIDDLHHERIDWKLWDKHIQPLVERRVKYGMPTVVSTTLPPSTDRFLPKGVIERLFYTAYCNYPLSRGEG